MIIRGGGAVNDLAYLNDYALARFVCLCPVPVLTGIGHERDNTLLDEVAHSRYDTPSKVITGIEQLIAARAASAKAEMAYLIQTSAQAVQSWTARIELTQADIESQASLHLSRSREGTQQSFAAVQLASLQSINTARQRSLGLVTSIQQGTTAELAVARGEVPALLTKVHTEVNSALLRAGLTTDACIKTILNRTALDANRQRQAIDRTMANTASLAVRSVDSAATSAQALVREIAGQGPGKTLGRGFVIVRTTDGKTVSRAIQLENGNEVTLQFSDGQRQALIHEIDDQPKDRQ